MNHVTRLLLAASLAVCAASAQAEPTTDLVILPAPASAWRITVGHWQGEAELTGDRVAAPRPTDEYARDSEASVSVEGRDGRRDALQFEWKDLWQATLRIESPQPLDLRPWLDGTLEFDLKADEMAHGGIKAKLGCGDDCERSVSLVQQARAQAGKGWQHVSLAMRCFVREGADFSKVKRPFQLEGNGSGRASVANVRLVRDGKPNADCPDYRTESVTPAMLNESWAIEWWLPRHEEKLAEARKLVAAGQSPELVFIGDSITQGWEKEGSEPWQRHYAAHHALNLGFGGDRTENVLWRLQHGALDGLAPKVTVLMIGTNNTGHRAEDPETTAAGVRRLVAEIRRRLPGTKLLLLAIFPRGEKPDDSLRVINARVNRLIAGEADGRQVYFLDINAALTDRDGTLSKDVMPDLLHPNANGYAIWQRAMQPLLQELLRGSAGTDDRAAVAERPRAGDDARPAVDADSGKAIFEWVEYAGADALFERKPPPGTFQNPILAGFYPDPSIERVGDDYYLVNSTFGFHPGVPVFHSRDLVNWTQVGNAIDRPDMMPFGPDVSLSGGGIYAPTIRHHEGTFYLITTCVGCGGNFILTTRDPAKGWSDPVWLPHIGGIDPSLFFDDDGRVYIVHHADPPAKKYPAHTQIRIMEVDPKSFAPLSEDMLLVDGSDKQPWHTDYIEGPHLYKVHGRYYLSAAGGGTGYYHQQLFYRADSPFGPFEANPRNPVLTQFGLPDDRPDPVTATGHADLVQDQTGDWWAVFLGTRVYDLATPPQDPGNFHTGRESFLLPVRWEDGWPVILAKGQPLPWTPKAPALPAGEAPAAPTTGNFGWREEFDAPALPPQWLFARTPRSQWWSTGTDGALALQPRADRIGGNGQPSFVGRRLQHMKASFSTRLRFSPARPGDEAGLLAVQSDDFFYAFGLGTSERGDPVLRIHRRSGRGDPADGVVLVERALGPEARDGLTLKIDIDRALVDFSYSAGGATFTTLLDDADARVLTTAVASGFTGAVVGPYAHKTASP